jgi:hypothetical protein
MNQKFFNKIVLFVALVTCSFSCSSDLDFEQTEDFSAQPVFTTNLAYVKLDAPDFESAGAGGAIFPYIANVDFLNTSFVEEDLIQAEMYFRIKNTIARAYVYTIVFLDANDAPIYNININVPASVGGVEVLVEQTESFNAANLNTLKNTTKMVFSIGILPGPPLTVTSPGRIELSSSLTAYFDVQ